MQRSRATYESEVSQLETVKVLHVHQSTDGNESPINDSQPELCTESVHGMNFMRAILKNLKQLSINYLNLSLVHIWMNWPILSIWKFKKIQLDEPLTIRSINLKTLNFVLRFKKLRYFTLAQEVSFSARAFRELVWLTTFGIEHSNKPAQIDFNIPKKNSILRTVFKISLLKKS